MAVKVGAIAYDVTLDLTQMSQAEKEVARKLGRIGDEGDKLQTRMTAVAAGVSAALSAIAVEGLISKIVSAQRQFDVLYSSLQTVTGGADQASAAWERLVAFAAKTPYTLDQSVKGFTKLKALGLDPSERSMMSFGNTASAMGKDLMQMIEAVADASTGEFERLKEFGIKAKAQGDQVSFTFQGVTTTVQNSASAITEYLTKIGEVNFDGAMEKRMNTLDGAMSNLEDAWAGLYLGIARSGFGDMVAEMAKSATQAIQDLTVSIESGNLVGVFANISTAVKATEVVVLSLAGAMTARLLVSMAAVVSQAYATATAVGAAATAMTAFNAVISALGGPIGIGITALTLLVLNWDKVAGASKTAADVSEDSAKRIAKALKESSEAAVVDLRHQLAEAEAGLKKAEDARSGARAGVGRDGAKSGYAALIDKNLADRIAAYKETIQNIKNALAEVENRGSDALRKSAGGRGGADAKGYGAAVLPDEKDQAKLDKFLKQYGTEAEKIAIAIKEAKKELGSAFTPEMEQKIRDRFASKSKTTSDSKPDKDPLGSFITDKINAQNERESRSKDRATQQQEQGRSLALETIAGQDPIQQLILHQEEKAKILRDYAEKDQESSALYAEALVALENETQQRILQLRQDARAKEAAAQSAQLQGLSQMFDSMAGITKTFAGEQSGIYKAMFAASKAFALADSIIKIQQGIAQASALPFPANLAAMGTVAAATAGIVSTIASTNYGGGRQYGGPVNAGSLYRVNETGKSEMFVGSNGSQYMIPGKNGRIVSANDIGSGPGVTVSGGSSITTTVQVNVYKDGSTDTAASSSGAGDTQTARQLGEMVGAKTKEVLVQEMRPGGLLWKLKMGQA